jgi:quercetin dioxygenase-like cupin family protein
MSHFIDSSEVRRQEIAPGVTIRTMWGEKIMMAALEIAPHAVVPPHTHPHEQAGMMLQGEFDLTIAGETRRVKPGDSYVIPGGVEHGVIGSEGWALAIDIFSPPREEYK